MLDTTTLAAIARTTLALANAGDDLDHLDAVLAVLDGPAPLDTLADRVIMAAAADVADGVDAVERALADAGDRAADAVRDRLADAEGALDEALDAVRDAVRGTRVRVDRVEQARYGVDEALAALDDALESLDGDADPVELLTDHDEDGTLDALAARLRVATRLGAFVDGAQWGPVRQRLADLGLLDHVARAADLTLHR